MDAKEMIEAVVNGVNIDEAIDNSLLKKNIQNSIKSATKKVDILEKEIVSIVGYITQLKPKNKKLFRNAYAMREKLSSVQQILSFLLGESSGIE